MAKYTFIVSGTGKRSGQPIASSSSSLSSANSDSDLKDSQLILRQLLLPERVPPSFPATNDLVLDSGNMAADVDSIYPDVQTFSRSKDIEQARSLLTDWVSPLEANTMIHVLFPNV